MALKVDLSGYKNRFGRRQQLTRLLWTVIWCCFARPLPRSCGNVWKCFLLRLFGAKIASTAVVYSSARIYQPWKLELEEYACLAAEVDCYNVDLVKVGRQATVSQKTYLCTASHRIDSPGFELITGPIVIEAQAWIAADAFVGPGVTVGEGAVVAARAVAIKDVAPWTVVGGNPAKFIKPREVVK